MVLDHERDHPSRWATVVSIAAKIGCTGQTLNEWVKMPRDNQDENGATIRMRTVGGFVGAGHSP